jgi:hypothetical protein
MLIFPIFLYYKDLADFLYGFRFKLKSFKLALTHYMGDWNAKLGMTLSPYLDQTAHPYQYKFNNEVSFLVQ